MITKIDFFKETRVWMDHNSVVNKIYDAKVFAVRIFNIKTQVIPMMQQHILKLKQL